MSKLMEKNDDTPKSNVRLNYRPGWNKREDRSDTEDSDKDDEESDGSSATAFLAARITPRAFEKSDHLYEKHPEREIIQEDEDWSWESEEFLLEGHIISKDTETSYTP
ncbi:unnamed protein product [Euphydryas editha]|uniref:Uncharacterized protein n=1 Tax=Euphydryas editha TaxID=104508 RepID=A0AAU9UUI3_EUPED|nr:unnamed protein product [Euphydryas editha]